MPGGYLGSSRDFNVETASARGGVRWYELRGLGAATVPVVHQQGTVSGNDGVHRWISGIAQDRRGNVALGYSVFNATTVFPGIRYTGRLATDPLGTMPEGKAPLWRVRQRRRKRLVDSVGVNTATTREVIRPDGGMPPSTTTSCPGVSRCRPM